VDVQRRGGPVSIAQNACRGLRIGPWLLGTRLGRPLKLARRDAVVNLYRLQRYVKGRALAFVWKARGIKIADRVSVQGRPPHIAGKGSIELGSLVSFRGFGSRSWFHVLGSAKLTIGFRSFINSGRNCLIGDCVIIQDSNYHEIDEGAGVKTRAVVIGDNVWIGRNAIILPGVEIGDHSVVGAGSVVTRSVPARSLVAGNPARIIREIEASPGYVRS
jgi:acetyltransferase-like isoleucine patch superfamily enzyme